MKPGMLFDLDGTIVDSEPVHLAALRGVFAEHGRELTDSDFASLTGTTSLLTMQRRFPGFEDAEHRRLIDRKEELFRLSVDVLVAIRGLPALLARAAEAGMRLGVVTNAPRLNAEEVLRHLGLDELFGAVVIGGELAEAKPDPLPYLVGLERLGLAASDTVAFEDSAVGVKSAVAAGILTVGVRTAL